MVSNAFQTIINHIKHVTEIRLGNPFGIPHRILGLANRLGCASEASDLRGSRIHPCGWIRGPRTSTDSAGPRLPNRLRFFVSFVETKHAPPRIQPFRSPPATGPPAAMALLAYRACGQVVSSRSGRIETGIIRLRRPVQAPLRHNVNVDERCPCADTRAFVWPR